MLHRLATVTVAVVALTLGHATPARATPITYTFGGSVHTVDPLLSRFFKVGNSLIGTFTYDDDPTQTGYPVTNGAFTVGPFSGANIYGWQLINSGTTIVGFMTGTWLDPFLFLNNALCCSPDRFNFVLTPTAPTNLIQTPIGLLPPNPLPFVPGGNFNVLFNGGGGNPFISGTMTSLTPVPEPTSVFLVGTGIALLARARHRSRNKQ